MKLTSTSNSSHQQKKMYFLIGVATFQLLLPLLVARTSRDERLQLLVNTLEKTGLPDLQSTILLSKCPNQMG
jgi:hypothetical protein